MQRVTPKAYDALQKFGRWIVELNDQSLRSEPETAVRSLLSSLHYKKNICMNMRPALKPPKCKVKTWLLYLAG